MRGRYFFNMFVLCFLVWAFVVDQAVIPGEKDLQLKPGTYSRYRVKHWSQNGKLESVMKDQLLVYVMVKEGDRLRERLFYLDYKPGFETSLRLLPKDTPVVVRFDNRFPKIWKYVLYDMRQGPMPVVRYSAAQLAEKQQWVWKFTGVMGGIYLVLAVLGLLCRPRRR